MKKPII
ncbi:52ab386f-2b9d-43ac-b897-1a704d451054 [Thermothielavioides terrestris]|nr:52ab386f-2b9d-43ac-b897-1a704d451054 [Thermothielavioides terrestris]